MSDIVAEITYHIERSGMSDKVTLDVGVLEHWRKEYAALKRLIFLTADPLDMTPENRAIYDKLIKDYEEHKS